MLRLLKALPAILAVAVSTAFFTSCGSSNAQVRFVNAIQNTADYGNGGLDVDVNGTKYFTDITFPSASASTYTAVPSGTDTIEGLEYNSTTEVFSQTTPTSLLPGGDYTMVATGFAGGTGGNVVLISPQDNNTAPTEGNVEFRVINASPSGPTAVDVYIEQSPFIGNIVQGTNQVTALSYRSTSAYVTLPWNSSGDGWQIYVCTTGSTTPIAEFDATFGSQTTESIRTFVLVDNVNGNTMSSAPIVLSDLN